MKFGHLGIITVASYLGGFCIALYVALSGYGVWALVFSEVISASIFALGAILFCRWIPGMPKIKSDIKSSLRFGYDISAFDFIQYFSRNIDRMLIGRFYGANSLGLYAKAFQMAMMPIEQIRMVFWDIGLSPLSTLQKETSRFQKFYAKFLSIMSIIYMPIVVLLIIKPESVISLLLGKNWLSAAPILRIVAIGGFFRPIIASVQLVMISYNRTRRYLKWGFISGLIMIIAFAIGIAWGTIGVACAFAAASFISLSWAFLYCLKDSPISPSLILKNIRIPFFASCGAGTVLAMIPSHLLPTSTLMNIVCVVSILFLVYAAILFSIPIGRQELIQFWSYRKELFVKT
jgi:O-antigen/teichoic acid export membrane protein